MERKMKVGKGPDGTGKGTTGKDRPDGRGIQWVGT